MEDCIFCKIIKGELKSHKIWEDNSHLAFLSIFPNTDGCAVVITKKHYSSYAFALPDNVLIKLIVATKKVAKLIDSSFDDVGRTGLVFEGFGIDHIHAKLFPMHGTKFDKWKPVKSDIDIFFKKYQGYISSHNGKLESDKKLKKIATKIKRKNNEV